MGNLFFFSFRILFLVLLICCIVIKSDYEDNESGEGGGGHCREDNRGNILHPFLELFIS